MNHTTKDGRTFPIAGMTDEHLLNTVKLFSAGLTELTKRIDETQVESSRRSAALYGDTKKVTPAQYRKAVNQAYAKLGPYIVEATVRGLDVRELLTKAFGRDTQDQDAPSYATTAPSSSLPGNEVQRVMKAWGNHRQGSGLDDPDEDWFDESWRYDD